MKLLFRVPEIQPARRRISGAVRRLPPLEGAPIEIRLKPALHVYRGRLTSRECGMAVHAATSIRKRRIVIEDELPRNPKELTRIFVHEVFHFVWVRLGNAGRRSYENLLAAEIDQGAHGELGWSAELRKNALRPPDRTRRTRRWREYVCESFCDSAACWLSGALEHDEFTLGARFRHNRLAWFSKTLSNRVIPI